MTRLRLLPRPSAPQPWHQKNVSVLYLAPFRKAIGSFFEAVRRPSYIELGCKRERPRHQRKAYLDPGGSAIQRELQQYSGKPALRQVCSRPPYGKRGVQRLTRAGGIHGGPATDILDVETRRGGRRAFRKIPAIALDDPRAAFVQHQALFTGQHYGQENPLLPMPNIP